MIKRAKENDRSAEVLRDTAGEKPTDRQQVESTNENINMTYEEYISKVNNKDAY